MRVRNCSLGEITDTVIEQIKEMMDSGFSEHPFPRRFSIDGFRSGVVRLIARGHGTLFILENDSGEFAGAMAGAIFPDLVSDVLTATEIIWRVNNKGKGFGHLLYDAFERWAKRKRADLILMGVMRDKNEEKISNFYKSRGFMEIGLQYMKGI